MGSTYWNTLTKAAISCSIFIYLSIFLYFYLLEVFNTHLHMLYTYTLFITVIHDTRNILIEQTEYIKNYGKDK